MAHQILRADEVFTMAIKIEEAGINFYKGCLNRARPEAQRVFNYLINQETKHVDLFNKMRTEVTSLKAESLAEDYPGEFASYMQAITADRVFYQPQSSTQQTAPLSESETIEQAIEFEKKSVVFYSWISEFVPEDDKAIVARIISEEHRHIAQLLTLQKTL